MTSAFVIASTASGVACTLGSRKSSIGSSSKLSIATSPTIRSPDCKTAPRSTGCSDIGIRKDLTRKKLRIRLMASVGRICISSNAFKIKLPRLCPANSPLPPKRYSKTAEAVVGLAII